MLALSGNLAQLSAEVSQFAQRLLTIGENRLELLLVEVQEERDRLLRAILLALGTAVFGLLAGVALTLGIAVWLWEYSPGVALLVLMFLYLGVAIFFYTRLTRLQGNWQPLPATLEQLKEDRKCLKQDLS